MTLKTSCPGKLCVESRGSTDVFSGIMLCTQKCAYTNSQMKYVYTDIITDHTL